MSTILKALRRLEQEKSAQAERPLREEVAAGSERAAPSPRRGLLVAASLGGGLAIGGALLWLWPASNAPEAPPPPVSGAAASAAPVRSVAPAPAPSTVARGAAGRADPDAPPDPEERLGFEAGLDEPDEPPVAVAEPARNLPPEALESPVEVVQRPRAGPKLVPPEPARAEPAQRAAEARARAEVARATAATAPARAAAPEPLAVASKPPAPAEPPPALPAPEPVPAPAAPTRAAPLPRAEVPQVSVQRTEWHPLAERRVAVVRVAGRDEPLRVHEGDAVGPLVVDLIEPSGVLFDHDGVELRLRLGENQSPPFSER